MSLIFDPIVWRTGVAPRVCVLVDVADYYAAARSAMTKARRSIHLLNWSFESRTRLQPEPSGGGPQETIGDLLIRLAASGLDVRVLCWKTALPVAATQDFFPLQDRRSFRGTAVRFCLDGGHPLGACHHQKVIVIDDAVAFCGSADFGRDRWDTTDHLDHDPRRSTLPPRRSYFDSRHEVMALMDGPPAAALAELFRDRWLRATGERLQAAKEPGASPWPDGVVPEFRQASVGISRAGAAWRSYPEIRETQALALASIDAARDCIYLENQYFTSPVVAEALAERLAETDGPEVLLVSTRHSPHWFDRMTMDRARADFIRRLRRADHSRRFHIYSPATQLGRTITVHSKLAIIDDDFVRVGSSNMNNRSVGFDTECDVFVSCESPSNRHCAQRLRSQIIAHWLGCPIDDLQEAVAREGRLGLAIESLRPAGHDRLRPISPARLGPMARFVAAFHLGDPLGPADSFRPLLRRRRLELEVAEVAAASGATSVGIRSDQSRFDAEL